MRADISDAMAEAIRRDLDASQFGLPAIGPFGGAAQELRHLQRHDGVIGQLVEVLDELEGFDLRHGQAPYVQINQCTKVAQPNAGHNLTISSTKNVRDVSRVQNCHTSV
jgi:hypothetical protein